MKRDTTNGRGHKMDDGRSRECILCSAVFADDYQNDFEGRGSQICKPCRELDFCISCSELFKIKDMITLDDGMRICVGCKQDDERGQHLY